MGIIGLILIVVGFIILFVAALVKKQVPRDYDYDSNDGLIDALEEVSKLLKIFAYISIILGIILIIFNYI